MSEWATFEPGRQVWTRRRGIEPTITPADDAPADDPEIPR
jgi:hypothetical protein